MPIRSSAPHEAAAVSCFESINVGQTEAHLAPRLRIKHAACTLDLDALLATVFEIVHFIYRQNHVGDEAVLLDVADLAKPTQGESGERLIEHPC